MEETMKKHVIKRTVRYWGYQVERPFLILLVMSIVYGMIGARFEISGAESTLFSIFVYLGMMGMVMILVMPMNYAGGCVPITLSMGAGRKEIFWGIQFSNGLFFVQMLLALGILGTLAMANTAIGMSGYIWGIIVLLFFLATAFGQLGAWFSMHYKAKGSVIYVVIIMAAIMAAAIGFGFCVVMMKDKMGLVARWENVQPAINVVCAVGLAIGAIVYVIGYRLLKKSIMTYEVYN